MRRHCIKCDIPLSDTNIYPSLLKAAFYICKKCYNAKVKDWYERNPQYVEQRKPIQKEYMKRWFAAHPGYMKDYFRQNVLNGKKTRVPKRPFPEGSKCEVCAKPRILLAYHHWDDEHPELGIWLCRYCHFIAEAVDNFETHKTVQTYLKKKTDIVSKT